VVVSAGGIVVGIGAHLEAGGPHAEVVALEAAGERARGATLYLTLEPCAHHGRTPPCADAVIAAGIAKVVAAVGDPNPKTDGEGFERLRAAGVEVELPGGELERRARRQNEAWRTWVAKGRPFVTYKAAVTLDGRVAAAGGDARWVSGEESRRLVHEFRAASDAVAAGMGTVRADRIQKRQDSIRPEGNFADALTVCGIDPVRSCSLRFLVSLDTVDLRLVRIEPAGQPLDHLGRRGRADLDPDDVTEAALQQLALDGLEEVVGVVRHLEVGVTRDAERRSLARAHRRCS